MEHFRTVDVSGLSPVDLVEQPAPQQLWVPITDLVIDDRYQRPLTAANWAAIERIAKGFQWSRFAPVIVAPVEGGRYALIDGQHRAHAAALCGIRSIPAMVALVAEQEQAQAFIDINTRQIAVRSQNVYRAALAARAPWALQCRDAVEAAGCRLMMSNFATKNRKPGQVFAIDLVRRLVEAGRADAVTAGLRALIEFDGRSVPNFANTLLQPWLTAAALTRANVDQLAAALEARRPWIVMDEADRLAHIQRTPKATARRDAFVQLLESAKLVVT